MTAPVGSNNDQTFLVELEELFCAKRRGFHRLAYRFLKHREDAEDVVQSAIVELLQRRAQGEIIANPVGFLVTAITHKALDTRDKREFRKQFHVSKAESEHIAAPDKLTDDRLAEVRAALAKMKPKLVDVLNLCCLEGRPIRETAKILGRPSGTVAADLFRAKFQVRTLIKIQEKKDEAQKNNRQGIPGAGLADASGA